MNSIQIICLIIIVLVIVIYFISIMYNKIKTQILKINSVENEIDTTLREKYDLLIKIINEIESIDKKETKFKNINELKSKELSSFDFERELNQIENNIITVKNNNEKLKKNKVIEDTLYNVININTKMCANIKYYNNSISTYNLLVSKLPTKILCFILKYKEKKYFDNKDMYDENIKDFKI